MKSTKDGTVFVVAIEDGAIKYNSTINFGFKESFFSYQPMTIDFEPLIILFAIPVLVFIYKKRTRK